jgi:uncharacterized protein YbjT (DUF2867 family)
VLTTPGHAGETYELTGPEAVSYGEIAARLGAIVGRTVEFIDVPPESARDSLRNAGTPEWHADGIIELMRAIRDGHLDTVSRDVERLTGRAPRSIDDFLRDHAAAFAPPPEAERPAPGP